MKTWQICLNALDGLMTEAELVAASGVSPPAARIAIKRVIQCGGAVLTSEGKYARTKLGSAYLQEMHERDVPEDIGGEKPRTTADEVVLHALMHAPKSVWDTLTSQ